MEMLEKIAANLLAIKVKKPLVHHLTNYVTVNDCANITLAIGASPVMADDTEEVEEMTSLAAALVLNIGTLNSRTIDSMLTAGRTAKRRGIPVILDPVGVGATKLRTRTALDIIRDVQPNVIRGNMSEIKVLSGQNAGIKGVDSTADAAGAEVVAKALAGQLNCVVAITGKVDIVTDGKRLVKISNGNAILSDVTGTGCMATSLVGCYGGAGEDMLVATAGGIVTMGLAGEIAYASLRREEGIGTFRIRLFDAVYNLMPEQITRAGRIEYEAKPD